MAQAQTTDAKGSWPAAAPGHSAADALAQARDALGAARDRIAREIRAYPMPISGCDAQFNHLLAQRQQLDRALIALATPAWIPTSRHPD